MAFLTSLGAVKEDLSDERSQEFDQAYLRIVRSRLNAAGVRSQVDPSAQPTIEEFLHGMTADEVIAAAEIAPEPDFDGMWRESHRVAAEQHRDSR